MRELICRLVSECVDEQDLPDLLWIVQQYARKMKDRKKASREGAAD